MFRTDRFGVLFLTYCTYGCLEFRWANFGKYFLPVWRPTFGLKKVVVFGTYHGPRRRVQVVREPLMNDLPGSGDG
jgi:hypothetical protein